VESTVNSTYLFSNGMSITVEHSINKKTGALIGIANCTTAKLPRKFTLSIPSKITDDKNNECEITSLGSCCNGNIPREITEYNISGTSLTLDIPDSVKVIKEIAFSSTPHIKHLTGMKGVKTVKSYAFSESHLEEISWPENCTEIQDYVFYRSSTRKLIILNAIEKISDAAFIGSKIEEIDFSKSNMAMIDVNNLMNICASAKRIILPDFMSNELDKDHLKILTQKYKLIGNVVERYK
jgi:hypothetical protein